ncbi:isopenicillin N synthase family dioxygenase [Pseudorhodoferax soli]|uniref:2-oxoglutarate-dependent ethylene/succinate-forming enzyme n=1 Tax=Pseudorhodoferax soli TaxID=545864 RepID=A0A368XNI3_9BURK|nr:2-oxoglutarate and iron-dependent oxygenase domain-containing protein [Pseudorhodoferax soli]RCW67574.1 isopenicillin N synthase-like dioxygenase [Pseudorhodoferax soli]
MDSFPCIDIAALAGTDGAARLAAAQAIGRACRETGFFAITGHGVPAACSAGVFAAAHAVFALPAQAKHALAIARHGHNRGYVGLGVEALDEATAPDLKEAYNLIWTDEATRPSNVWPPIDGWRAQAQAYFDAVLAVGRRLHRAFALDLGLAEDFFDDKLDRPQATLRLLHYPERFAADAPAGRAGAGAHTDYGNVTLLATDGVAGLQVQRRGGGWTDVPALPGAFVCNIGDCLMRWSNDVYVSTPHRVLPPARARYSVAFFLDPNPDALVSAIPGCVPAGELPRHAPVTAGDYLRQRLAATYG